MIAFCRYWRMTPREVDLLTGPEYEAMTRFADEDIRRQQRAARRGR